MNSCQPENFACVVVDMVNGFVKAGAMADPAIMGITPAIVRLRSSASLNAQTKAAASFLRIPTKRTVSNLPPFRPTVSGEPKKARSLTS